MEIEQKIQQSATHHRSATVFLFGFPSPLSFSAPSVFSLIKSDVEREREKENGKLSEEKNIWKIGSGTCILFELIAKK